MEFWDAIAQSDLALGLRESEFAFPTLESIHLIGVAIFFGSIVMVDLRLLGLGRTLSIKRLAHYALPLTWIGFALQLASGIPLFIASADQYVRTVSFPLKMALIVAGGVNMIIFQFTTWRHVDEFDQRRETPDGARIAGLISVAIWVGAIIAGRWIGYERRPVF